MDNPGKHILRVLGVVKGTAAVSVESHSGSRGENQKVDSRGRFMLETRFGRGFRVCTEGGKGNCLSCRLDRFRFLDIFWSILFANINQFDPLYMQKILAHSFLFSLGDYSGNNPKIRRR